MKSLITLLHKAKRKMFLLLLSRNADLMRYNTENRHYLNAHLMKKGFCKQLYQLYQNTPIINQMVDHLYRITDQCRYCQNTSQIVEHIISKGIFNTYENVIKSSQHGCHGSHSMLAVAPDSFASVLYLHHYRPGIRKVSVQCA